MLIADIVWTIPVLLFVVVVVGIRLRPTPALLVFFGGPLIGTLAFAFAVLLTNQMFGRSGLPQVRNLLLSGPLIYLFVLPRALYPHGALLGALMLLIYARLERSYELAKRLAGRRLATGLLIGGAVGGLFAAFVMFAALLTQQNVDFVRFITNGTVERLDLSTELLLSIATGAADGALIATLGVKSLRPKHFHGAIKSATT
jgi:hypothetical protein